MTKLRVGVLLNTYNIANWYFELLKRIDASDFAEIGLVIINGEPRDDKKRPGIFNKNLLYTIYQKLDKKLFKKSPDSQKIVNTKPFLEKFAHITVVPEKIKYYQKFPAGAVQAIREKNVDVLLRIGFGIMKGDILTATPLGIWSYHHGDDEKYRGMPSCFWEVYNKEYVTSAMLQILTEELDSGIVLSKGWSRTETVSVNRSRHALYWRSLSFVLDNLKRCHAIGAEKFMAEKKSAFSKPFIDTEVYKTPTNGQMVKFLWKLAGRLLARRFDFHWVKYQWRIIYTEKGQRNLSKFKTLVPPANSQWADPFVLKKGGEPYIFFENLDTKHFGTIYCTSITDIKNKTAPKLVLKRDYHLSYPYVFEYEGEYYMMPETKQDKKIQIFRAVSFPDKWEPYHVVMDNVEAVDSSFFQHNGKWWLFTNMCRVPGASSGEELHLFYADSPFAANWTPHPLNPVLSDARRSRNAGSIFTINGKIYRPSQDCAIKYGYSVGFNEIKELTENTYAEKLETEILPHWQKNINGIHTAVKSDDFWVMDVRKYFWFSIKP